MQNNICSKTPETCSSIPPGGCGPDCHGFTKFTSKVRTSVEKMSKFLYSADTGIKLDGSKNLATTGAAVYYKGNGWWCVSSYAWDLKDAKDIINALK